jgi:hypothetical protein
VCVDGGSIYAIKTPSLQFCFRLETSLNHLFQVSDSVATQSLASCFPLPGAIPFLQQLQAQE